MATPHNGTQAVRKRPTAKSAATTTAPTPNDKTLAQDAAISTTKRRNRETDPRDWRSFNVGAAGIIPRRGNFSPTEISTVSKLDTFATTNPMRLLALLPDVHPSVGFALWNALRLTCPPDGFRIQAIKAQKSSTVAAEPDDAATMALDKLWESLPSEIGGLMGLQTQLTIEALFTGLVCVEAVPATRLKGLSRVWPVSSLTIAFGRDDRNADLTAYQYQTYSSFSNTATGKWSQQQISEFLAQPYKRLNPQTFFWSAIDPMVDEPYGRAPYAPALAEVMRDLALIQDLGDAIHNSAWPRTDVGVDKTALHKIAVEVHHINNPIEAAKWVKARFQEVVDYMQEIQPGDNIVHDSNGQVKPITPGGFDGLEGVLAFLRHRLVMALKTLPTLMGINDNGNFNYTSVEWAIYAAGLETLRAIVAHVLLKVANLHLRLIGSSAKAIAKYTPIRVNDALVEANTEMVQLQNATGMIKMGFKSQKEAGMELTGHAPVGPPMPGALEGSMGNHAGRETAQQDRPSNGGTPGGGSPSNNGESQETKRDKKQNPDTNRG